MRYLPLNSKISIFDFVYTLASAKIDQSVLKLATVYIAMKSRMSLIIGQIESENRELFALEFGKIAESDLVYTLASTNIDQSASNLVKMYMTIRSRICSIMDLIGPELSELCTLELENFLYLTFLLFPQCFLPIWITLCHFRQILNCRLQSLSVWKCLKFVVW